MIHEIRIVGAGGEYMESVTVISWHAKLGDRVKAGDVIVVIETAKAATEIEAPADGILREIKAEVGAEIPIGEILGVIDDGDAAMLPASKPAPPAESPAPTPAPGTATLLRQAPVPPQRPRPGRQIVTPLARRVARSLGVNLEAIEGTGPRGRIKRRDVLRHADGLGHAEDARPALPAPATRDCRAAFVSLRRGSGTPIVLIHGFGADSQSWYPLVQALGGSQPIIGIDLPSHGKSARSAPGDIAEMAAAVAETLATREIHDLHLCGHSLGGAVALALTEIIPAQMASLALIAPAGLGCEIDHAFLSGFARASKAASLGPWLNRLVADPSLITPGFVQATMLGRTDQTLRDAQLALAEHLFPDGTPIFDYRRVLSRLQMPTKIIWGQRDTIMPWRQALVAPGAVALHFLAETGHLPHVEAPAIVSRLLNELIRCASQASVPPAGLGDRGGPQ